MAELNKAIGLRIPPKLWEEIKEYGLENYPGSKSKEGFDVTRTIVNLLAQALGNPSGSQELDNIGSASIDILARLEALENAVDAIKSQLPMQNIAKAATKTKRKVDR